MIRLWAYLRLCLGNVRSSIAKRSFVPLKPPRPPFFFLIFRITSFHFELHRPSRRKTCLPQFRTDARVTLVSSWSFPQSHAAGLKTDPFPRQVNQNIRLLLHKLACLNIIFTPKYNIFKTSSITPETNLRSKSWFPKSGKRPAIGPSPWTEVAARWSRRSLGRKYCVTSQKNVRVGGK